MLCRVILTAGVTMSVPEACEPKSAPAVAGGRGRGGGRACGCRGKTPSLTSPMEFQQTSHREELTFL